MSIIEKILANSESTPEKVAIYDKDKKVTYLQFVTDIRRLAAKLNHHNVGYGDAVLIEAENSYDFISLYFSLQFIGAIVVNIAADVDANYKQFVSNKVQPSLCIEECSSFAKNIHFYDPLEQVHVSSNSCAELMFTSGTTGEPKGVVLTHRQLAAATEHIISQVRNCSEDVELLLMPLSHSFGLARMRTTLFAGGTLVVGYPLQRLKSVFKIFEKYHVTGIGLVPSAWKFITQMSKDLIAKYAPQLNYIEFGSAFLSPEDKSILTQWFPDTHIAMHYGLTEVSRAVYTHFHKDDHNAVGHIDKGADFIIIKDNGERASEGEIGEIAFRAPWMSTEYYQNEDLTSASFVYGYFRTGDLGKYEGQYLYLTGRLKEMINVGGKKVSPYQVEKILNIADFVMESACFPAKHNEMGEIVSAAIVLDTNTSIGFDEVVEQLKELAAEYLPVHMRPQNYMQVKVLPKTSSGKVKRLQLSSK